MLPRAGRLRPLLGAGDRAERGDGGLSASTAEGGIMDAPRQTIARARRLRRAMTPPELRLWTALRMRPDGFKFRRQHPFGPYVLDSTSMPPSSASKWTAPRTTSAATPRAISHGTLGCADGASRCCASWPRRFGSIWRASWPGSRQQLRRIVPRPAAPSTTLRAVPRPQTGAETTSIRYYGATATSLLAGPAPFWRHDRTSHSHHASLETDGNRSPD
jgi:hypothetical protein